MNKKMLLLFLPLLIAPFALSAINNDRQELNAVSTSDLTLYNSYVLNADREGYPYFEFDHDVSSTILEYCFVEYQNGEPFAVYSEVMMSSASFYDVSQVSYTGHVFNSYYQNLETEFNDYYSMPSHNADNFLFGLMVIYSHQALNDYYYYAYTPFFRSSEYNFILNFDISPYYSPVNTPSSVVTGNQGFLRYNSGTWNGYLPSNYNFVGVNYSYSHVLNFSYLNRFIQIRTYNFDSSDSLEAYFTFNLNLYYDSLYNINQPSNNAEGSYSYISGVGNANNALYGEGYEEGYRQGYTYGYDTGAVANYDIGYDDGHLVGYNTGYNSGYTVGHAEGVQDANQYTFMSLFGSIADTPILIIRGLFDFDLFGVNVLVVILSLFTALLLFYVLKKLIK